ncbi:MAG: nucleoside-diphosphate sugar epimerase/dehydratase [Candidatus Omnitrophota bacterium]|jgi:FlaA1/EpsC-like NDP-sugar epimerase
MRNRHFVLLDIALLAPLPFLVVALRFESLAWSAETTRAVLVYALLALPIRLAVAWSVGLYRALWKHASLAELERIFFAGAVSGLITFLVGAVLIRATGLSAVRMPYSSLLWDALLAANLMALPRIAVRALNRTTRRTGRPAKRALIAGAGEVGQSILRALRTHGAHFQFEVVGFVDDDPTKKGMTLGGISVLGSLGDIARVVREQSVDELIIAIPSPRGSLVRRLVASATEAGAKVQIVPGIRDLVSGRVRVEQLRQVQIEDLLRRDPIVTDLAQVRLHAANKVVLVTGAGGSIGSELCRQIAALDPSRLVLLDHSENQVFEISGEMRRLFPKLAMSSVIADIRDAQRIHAVFERFQPYAVFHAAAHKHVPLMEDNIVEAVTNNILGTQNVVDAAIDADTQQLVFISTDKAVRPTSIMGATKRVAEHIVQQAAKAERRNFVSVRFGNVLGSRGSVIPTFLNQIKNGGPVTVTHPEMRRYFMTIPEAVQLVLQAGALGKGGELFVLDMGESVKIVDLARDLIRLSGLEEGVDVDIEYTGVRPGEKLYEEVLFGDEAIRTTSHPKVLCTDLKEPDADVMARLDLFVRTAMTAEDQENKLRELLHTLVPDFAHEDARTDPRVRRSDPAAASVRVV